LEHVRTRPKNKLKTNCNDSNLNDDGDDVEEPFILGNDDTSAGEKTEGSSSSTIIEDTNNETNKEEEEIRSLRNHLQEYHDRDNHIKDMEKVEATLINKRNQEEQLNAAMKKTVQSTSKAAKKVMQKATVQSSPKNATKVAGKNPKERKIDWDIEADTSVKHTEYKPPYSASLNDAEDDDEEGTDDVVLIHNIRKKKGCQVQFLCEYRHGTLWWNTIKSAYKENELLVEQFLEEKNIGVTLDKTGKR
jgi:hypothetical protein